MIARACTASQVKAVTWCLAVCFGVRLSDDFNLTEWFYDCKHFFQISFRVLICKAFLFVGIAWRGDVPLVKTSCSRFVLFVPCVYAYAFNVQLLN